MMLAAVGLAGCQADSVVYDGLTGENDADKGQGKVMFADSAMIIAIQNSTDWHDVVIGTTRPVVGDRHFGIEVVAKESNAIEGLHYTTTNALMIPKFNLYNLDPCPGIQTGVHNFTKLMTL